MALTIQLPDRQVITRFTMGDLLKQTNHFLLARM